MLAKACNQSNALNRTCAKFLSIYAGPYVIHEIIYKTPYIIIDPETKEERGLFHGSSLIPYT